MEIRKSKWKIERRKFNIQTTEITESTEPKGEKS